MCWVVREIGSAFGAYRHTMMDNYFHFGANERAFFIIVAQRSMRLHDFIHSPIRNNKRIIHLCALHLPNINIISLYIYFEAI